MSTFASCCATDSVVIILVIFLSICLRWTSWSGKLALDNVFVLVIGIDNVNVDLGLDVLQIKLSLILAIGLRWTSRNGRRALDNGVNVFVLVIGLDNVNLDLGLDVLQIQLSLI